MRPLYNTNKQMNKNKGFTLMELVIVIVLLGVIAVGVSGVIRLATQTFINVSERDELASSARFALERLNREIRNALPGSIRNTPVVPNSRSECIEFMPIAATSHYLNLPINPTSSNNITVIPFINNDGTDYTCNNCGDKIIVNPLINTEVYTNFNVNTGKIFKIANTNIIGTGVTSTLQITLSNSVSFDSGSPANKFYIVNESVEFCLYKGIDQLYRISYSDSYDTTDASETPIRAIVRSIMAGNVRTIDDNPAFVYDNPNLTRNGVVKIDLEFYREDTDDVDTQETVAFNHEVHIKNTP